MSDKVDVIKKGIEETRSDMGILKTVVEEVGRKGDKLSKEFIGTASNLADYKTQIFKEIEDIKQHFKKTSDEQQFINKEVSSIFGF